MALIRMSLEVEVESSKRPYLRSLDLCALH